MQAGWPVCSCGLGGGGEGGGVVCIDMCIEVYITDQRR